MAEKTVETTRRNEVKTKISASHKHQTDVSHFQNSPAKNILSLQGIIGNQAVSKLIKSGVLQAKLRIYQSGDKYEQEADRTADAVMLMPEPKQKPEMTEFIQTHSLAEKITPLVQRKVEEEGLQTKRRSKRDPEITSDLESHIQSIKGSGQPLSESARNYFEPRFGHDFSHVRVHTDTQAVESAQAVNARAFTIGKDIFFGAGQYETKTNSGKHLMAHELTHTIQQHSISRSNQSIVGSGRIVPGIQRQVKDQVVLEPVRPNADACLVHLHGNEKNALNVAKGLYKEKCVNLVFIKNPGRRHILADVPGHKGVTCSADPNRIFEDVGITGNWKDWHAKSKKKCLNDPVKSKAQEVIKDFRDTKLEPAIRQCRGQPLQKEKIKGEGVTGPYPVAAFHNNRPGPKLTIKSYEKGGGESSATERDPGRLKKVKELAKNSKLKKTPENPHISNKDVDNFFLVTDPADFVAFVKLDRNVVLQAKDAPRDGSLSVVLKSGRYINVEAKLTSKKTQKEFDVNKAMAIEAMDVLKVRSIKKCK